MKPFQALLNKFIIKVEMCHLIKSIRNVTIASNGVSSC